MLRAFLAFLVWLGGQPWATWLKVTLFLVTVLVLARLIGGPTIAELIGGLR